MDSTALAVIMVCQIVITLAVGAFVAWNVRFRFDVKRVCDVMAADLIELYGDDLHTLSERGIKEFARKRYMQICTAFGLPSGLVDYVSDSVTKIVMTAQDGGLSPEVSPIYE